MKTGAVSNNIYNNKQIHSKNMHNPNFAARVEILMDARDSISGTYVSLAEGPLKRMSERLAKILESFDPNLKFKISGAGKLNFWELFKSNPTEGLKVDISYFDIKKAYLDILNKPKQEQLLKEITINGLKRKDPTLLGQLGQRIGVGKYFRPKTETENQYVEKLTNMIKQNIIEMPNRLLEAKTVELKPDGKFAAWHDALYIKGEDCRNCWAWYKGIEY